MGSDGDITVVIITLTESGLPLQELNEDVAVIQEPGVVDPVRETDPPEGTETDCVTVTVLESASPVLLFAVVA